MVTVTQWTTHHMPSQRGRRAIVTGTGGLGFQTALALAQAGAEVTLAGRNADNGAAAVARINENVSSATIRFEPLDLASLRSVAAFADRMLDRLGGLDILVNNAGLMMPPVRSMTEDRFELQFGTNYLGHFALTARLLPLLRHGRNPRVVSLSSLAHRSGRIDFEDLQSERAYRPWAAYGQSKLAMLMFALELQRRSDAAGWGLMSNAAHPGIARTELFRNHPGARGFSVVLNRMHPFISQSPAAGALPTLFAATAPEANGGAYYGPNGFHELRGSPAPARIIPRARDPASNFRLWEISEFLTNQSFAWTCCS